MSDRDITTITETVFGCGNCRFRPDASKGACSHPKAWQATEDNWVRNDCQAPPDWCPLETAPVLTILRRGVWTD